MSVKTAITKLFTDIHSFNELLECSNLFYYLVNLPKIEEIKIMEIPAHFEDYIKNNITSENQILIDKVFNNLDNTLTELQSRIDDEALNCTTEFDRDDSGNFYMSDWNNTEQYNELYQKLNFLNKIHCLEIWYN